MDELADAVLPKASPGWRPLLDAFLESVSVAAVVGARAAVAIEGNGNACAAGCLFPRRDEDAGVTVAFEYSAAYGYGAGLQFLVNFGFEDAERLIDRVGRRAAAVAGAAPAATERLRILLPLTLRALYAVGGGLTTPDADRRTVARTALGQAIARSLQEVLLDALAGLAVHELEELIARQAWSDKLTPGRREDIVGQLRAARDRIAGAGSTANEPAGWLRQVADTIPALWLLTDADVLDPGPQADWKDSLALLWAAAELALAVVDSSVRTQPFQGSAPDGHAPLKGYVAGKVNARADALSLADLVAFLLQIPEQRLNAVLQGSPATVEFLQRVTRLDSPARILREVLVALAASPTEGRSEALRLALVELSRPLVGQLAGELRERSGDSGPGGLVASAIVPSVEALPLLLDSVGRLDGSQVGARILREQISAALLQLTVRPLLGCTDALLDHASAHAARSIEDLANRLDPKNDNDVLNAIFALQAWSPVSITREDAQDLLRLSARVIERWNDTQRDEWVPQLEALLTLGLADGGRIGDAWQALERHPNTPLRGEVLTGLVARVTIATWRLFAFVLLEAGKLLLAHLGRWLLKVGNAIVDGVRAAVEAIKASIESLGRWVEEEARKLLDWIVERLKAIQKELDRLWRQISDFFESIGDFIGDIFSFSLSAVGARLATVPGHARLDPPARARAAAQVANQVQHQLDEQAPLLEGPRALPRRIMGWSGPLVDELAASGELSTEVLLGRLRTMAWRTPARDLHLAVTPTTGGASVGVTVPASQVLGSAIAQSLAPKVQTLYDQIAAKEREKRDLERQRDIAQAALDQKLGEKQARERLISLPTNTELAVEIHSPSNDQLVQDHVELAVTVRGANSTFVETDPARLFGMPTRIKVMLNGADLPYQAGQWTSTGQGLIYRATIWLQPLADQVPGEIVAPLGANVVQVLAAHDVVAQDAVHFRLLRGLRLRVHTRGKIVRCTVQLPEPAPASGAVVTVTSSDTDLVGHPGNISIEPGATTAPVPITHNPEEGGMVILTAQYVTAQHGTYRDTVDVRIPVVIIRPRGDDDR
jgi:hypothetical protein